MGAFWGRLGISGVISACGFFGVKMWADTPIRCDDVQEWGVWSKLQGAGANKNTSC